MDNNSSMLQLCRLCLVKDDVNIPIFEEQGDIRQIFLKISSCLPVKLSRDDRLPKKICDGCSYKLDMLYEFWNTSANAEKQLLTWLGEAGMTSKMTDGTISAVAQQIKPADAFVKQETIDPPDIRHEDDDDDKNFVYNEKHEENARNNADEPPPKRARRTAAVKAAIAMDQDSDDDDDSGEPMTKMEDDSEDSDNDDQEPSFADVPSTSADDQPGPSGVNKDGVEAPCCGEDNTPTSIKIEDESKKTSSVNSTVIAIKKDDDEVAESSICHPYIAPIEDEYQEYMNLDSPPAEKDPLLLETITIDDDASEATVTYPKIRIATNLIDNTAALKRVRKPKSDFWTCDTCGNNFYSKFAYTKHKELEFLAMKKAQCGLSQTRQNPVESGLNQAMPISDQDIVRNRRILTERRAQNPPINQNAQLIQNASLLQNAQLYQNSPAIQHVPAIQAGMIIQNGPPKNMNFNVVQRQNNQMMPQPNAYIVSDNDRQYIVLAHEIDLNETQTVSNLAPFNGKSVHSLDKFTAQYGQLTNEKITPAPLQYTVASNQLQQSSSNLQPQRRARKINKKKVNAAKITPVLSEHAKIAIPKINTMESVGSSSNLDKFTAQYAQLTNRKITPAPLQYRKALVASKRPSSSNSQRRIRPKTHDKIVSNRKQKVSVAKITPVLSKDADITIPKITNVMSVERERSSSHYLSIFKDNITKSVLPKSANDIEDSLPMSLIVRNDSDTVINID